MLRFHDSIFNHCPVTICYISVTGNNGILLGYLIPQIMIPPQLSWANRGFWFMKQIAAFGDYRVLNGRYALLERLATAAVGNIYRGRDLELIPTHGRDSQVLIHIFPKNGFHATPNQLFTQLEVAYQNAGSDAILPAINYGMDAETPFMVLQSPNESSIVSCASPDTQAAGLPFKARRRLHTLQGNGKIGKPLDPALLLLSFNQQLYVLGTALLPEIQALCPDVMPISLKQRRLHFLLGCLGLTAFATVSAATGSYFIQANLPPSHLVTDMADAEAKPKIFEAHKALPPASAPSSSVSNPHALVDVPALSMSLLTLTNASPLAMPTETITLKIPTAPQALPKVIQTLHTTHNGTSQEKPPTTPNKGTAQLKPSKPSKVLAAPVVTPLTFEVSPSETPQTTPATGDFEQLLTQANQAITENRLEEARQYTASLREQARLHPQVKRLGDAIVSNYHQQARTALQHGDTDTAKQVLAEARSTIKDFNLTKSNAGQAVLEHKTAASE